MSDCDGSTVSGKNITRRIEMEDTRSLGSFMGSRLNDIELNDVLDREELISQCSCW